MTPRDANDSGAVETAADFVAYLNLLSEDHVREVEEARDPGDWAHWDLGAFLEAWAAYLAAVVVEGRPDVPEDLLEPSWRSFAQHLDAARRYE
ncbi:DUF7660 family protein [Lentzea nigeriaca]|uniref:DUF7660 family protein n=1 Tax=Lentzea nigeriaca TaxID=1128665 RepID=UPI001956A3E9|nr:hypothetical protein [Lentzea nigeriaca]MBM7857697.1 hypothetical protein [Lentzea nigeriaca]